MTSTPLYIELQTTDKVKCILTDVCHEKDSKKEAKLKKRHISNIISDFTKRFSVSYSICSPRAYIYSLTCVGFLFL